METVNLRINGLDVQAPKDSTILEAANSAGVLIPTLCYLKEINAIGACRMCVVEVKGARSFAAACVHPISEGMEVQTNTEVLRKSRKMTLELTLSNHRMECLSCERSLTCELQTLAREYRVDQNKFSACEDLSADIDDSTPHLIRDNSKCVLCRRCVAVCRRSQHVGVIGAKERGLATCIGSAFDLPLEATSCVYCGQCIAVCPTGALTEKFDHQKLWDAIADPAKHVVIAPAPAVRAQLGEYFGMPIGANVEGKLVTALRRLAVDKVFDVDTAADFTIMEEGTEFLGRLEKGGPFPIFTSCSPAWVKFCEHYYPDMLTHLSSCKSPQQMYGALMKTYYAEKEGIKPENIFVASVMPCTAKKFEIKRDNQNASGYPDVDVTITTRELAAMIKEAGIVFEDLPDGEFDPAFGVASGAGHIFGVTGGVMEAALRTVFEVATGKPLEKLDFHDVRGVAGIKEAEYELAGTKVKIAVASGLSNAKKLVDMIKNGEKEYHFVEIMACSGGCVNGGGQPHQPGYVRNFVDLRAKRAEALYSEDQSMTLRKSHENPVVKEVYASYLGKPGGDKAHKLLHTSYVAREV
jgi:NADP-reducing hydrogenase subunit HndD